MFKIKYKLTLAFPADTVPPFLNTGGSFASCSNVTSGLGCSSTRNCFTPLRVFISTGHISLSNFPAFCAVKG